MPTPRSRWIAIDLSPKMDNAEFGDGDAVQVTYPVPVNGVIQEAWYAVGAMFNAGNLQLHKFISSASSVNLLSTVNVLISSNAISANTGQAITLTTNRQHLKVAPGQVLKAIWTFTTVGSGDGPSCVVWVEPKTW